jgi:hypothetical protein
MKMKGMLKTPKTPEQKAARREKKKGRFLSMMHKAAGTEYSPTMGPMQNPRFTRRTGPN